MGVAAAPPVSPGAPLGHHRAYVLRHRRACHHARDAHHDLDDRIEVGVDFRVAVNLQVAGRPLLVEDAQGYLRAARDGLGLCPLGHRRDEDLVLVQAVEDDRHRWTVLGAAVAEDRGAVIEHELLALLWVMFLTSPLEWLDR